AALAAGCATSPGKPVPSASGELPAYQIQIDLLGKKREITVNSQHKLITSVQFISNDSRVSLAIDKGTRLLDKDGRPLEHIQVTTTQSLPLPPEGAYIVGAVYELDPQGATVDPPLRLTLSYDPEELPEGVREGDVYIAPYDEGMGWSKSYYKSVDTKNHRVTTQVNHFAKFAVLAPIMPTSPQLTPKPPPGPDLTSIPLQQALSSGKPTLAEFGWRTCIPCKQMKPILEELAVEYEGKLNVVIVEVYEQRALTQQYSIMAIPTQIVFDSSGKEVTRHIGLWPKKEITTQLKKMGVN
ncbi:MAG: hypothetical protein CO103_06035, partial [Chloroflexi bacterium CG_4_9_14_3_um_filter_45_9]